MAERKNYLLNVNGVKAIAKLAPPAKRKRYSDGDSLHLVHDPKGSLYWVMTYRYQSDKDIKPKQNDIKSNNQNSVFLINTEKPEKVEKAEAKISKLPVSNNVSTDS